MSRPASSRSPAHERVVRNLRLAQATIEKLRNELLAERAVADVAIDEVKRGLKRDLESSEARIDSLLRSFKQPIPMRIPCPRCSALHIDEGEWATRVHTTHTCQHCGECFKPCLSPTVGVRFLPGTKNEP
jgi:hypothetical protein